MARLCDLIDTYAKALAEETGLDYARVRKVVAPAASGVTSLPGADASRIDADCAGIRIWPDLREAIPYLGPDRSVQFFEETGIDELRTRLRIIDLCCGAGAPLYRSSELRTHITALRAHLSRNRGDLLQTGYASELYAESLWLAARISALYPVKSPSFADIAPEADRSIKIYHIWTRERWTTTWDASGKVTIYRPASGMLDPGPIEYCEYAEAPLLDGLTPEMAGRIVALRPSVFDFKLEVMELLGRVATRRPAAGTVGKFLDVLTHRFSSDEAKDLLALDRIFLEAEMGEGLKDDETLIAGAGGILDMIRLVLLAEERLNCRAVDDLREFLDEHDLISKEPFADPRPVFGSYFETVDQPFHDKLVEALAAFVEVCREAAPALEESFESIRRALPAEAGSRQIVWGAEAQEFSLLLEAYGRFQKVQRAATGRFGRVSFGGEHLRVARVCHADDDSVRRPPRGTRLGDLSLNLTQDGLEVRAGSWSARHMWADLFPERAPGRRATVCRTALQHFARRAGALRVGDDGLPRNWDDRVTATYMSKFRTWMKSLLWLSENPVLWDNAKKAYFLCIKIAEDGRPAFPTPNGATWGAVTIEELEDGRIEVSVGGVRRFGGRGWEEQADGDGHPVETTVTDSETVTRRFTMQELGLAGLSGRDAIGRALCDLLRARGKIARDADDVLMSELNSHLRDLLNIDGEPFDVRSHPQGGSVWTAEFRASSCIRR